MRLKSNEMNYATLNPEEGKIFSDQNSTSDVWVNALVQEEFKRIEDARREK